MKTILIVDDDPLVCELLITLFSNEYKFIVANNGKEGVEKFKENISNINLVITDFNMPIMNGFEMVKAIRFLSRGVKIIFHSAGVQQLEMLFDGLNFPINHFLSKPASCKEIQDTVNRLLLAT